MPVWLYGYLICSCLYAFSHGGKTIKNRRSPIFPRLKPTQAVLVGWVELGVNSLVFVLALCGLALHLTYP